MKMKTRDVLKRIGDLERELEHVKKDLLHLESGRKEEKSSLYGSVRGGDITDEMIEEAKKDLFRRSMIYVLDTHVLIWYFTGRERLLSLPPSSIQGY
ncbi:MAG: hypothetical protein ACOC5L_02985 [Halobacteriota archaeon]